MQFCSENDFNETSSIKKAIHFGEEDTLKGGQVFRTDPLPDPVKDRDRPGIYLVQSWTMQR